MSGGPGPKMAALGEAVRLVPVDLTTTFKISAVGFSAEDVNANVISKLLIIMLIRILEHSESE